MNGRYALSFELIKSTGEYAIVSNIYTAISRKDVGKKVHATIRKVIWDMINTLFLTL